MPQRRRRTRRNAAHHHAEWLSLIEISGPFLSIPVLKEVFPEGLDKPGDESEVKAQLRANYEQWQEKRSNLEYHEDWAELVLDLALGFDQAADYVRSGNAIDERHCARIREHHETLVPRFVLVDPEAGQTPQARLLVQTVPPDQNLETPLKAHRWKASPATRMAELLRNCTDDSVRLGIVTNGEDWMLVHAPRKGTSGFARWRADLWFEEAQTLSAFRTLLSVDRFFGRPEDTLESLYDRSEKGQFEVTETLGLQVRDAVELLVDTIDMIDKERNRELLADYPERRLYEAVVSVMMRLVFVLFAEENDLLPAEDPVYQQNYALSPLLDQLREDADKSGEQTLQHRTSAWHRLLATFRAIHGGVDHEDMRLPAYGGSLFDPDHYPFLEGRARNGNWREEEALPLPVDDLTILRLLESLLLLEVGGTPGQGVTTQRLSYSSLGIEQIGNVYESLLDHTVLRADDIVLGLHGKRGLEPEVSLGRIVEAAAQGGSALVKLLKEETQKPPAQIKRMLEERFPDDDPRWRQVVGGDDEALERIKPYAGLVRDDHIDMPMVREPSAVYVTQTSSRRDSGTQYTPPSFTEPIVRYALEPLVYEGPAEGKPEEEWKLKSPREILQLKICDLAMGSAAFLVQTCRYLGDRLVEGWEAIEQANPGKILVSPEGDLSTGDPSESIIPGDIIERIATARRYVAERCVYGIDKDPMAVEMAKLSMWLVTMQKGKPFSFLDHALKCGDALLGVARREQFERFDLEPADSKQISIFEKTLSEALGTALEKRIELESIAVNDIRDAEEKARLYRDAEESLRIVRLVGDLLLGVGLASYLSDFPSYKQLRDQISAQLAAALSLAPGEERDNSLSNLAARSQELLQAGTANTSDHRRPFHWPLEFPEIILESNASDTASLGFNAFVGNPPFQGGQKITGVLGTNYRNHLVERIAGGRRGSADLCAYMFLRIFDLLQRNGRIGLIATNTIAQGDTREVGLDQITATSTISRAVRSQPWPGDANLEVSVVWMTKGQWRGNHWLDNRPVSGITSYLTTPGQVVGNPHRLKANKHISFQGSTIWGMGFVLEPHEAAALIDKNPRNRDVLFPYLNGKDLNSRWDQSASRWAINFFDWPLDQDSTPDRYSGPVARDYPECLKILEERVKPERQRRKEDGTYALRKPLPERWWQYGEKRPKLYSSIQSLPSVLVCAAVSKHLSFALCPSRTVFSHALFVFANNSFGFFATLSSSLHDAWTAKYQSSLRKDRRYTPSDCFETFPFPKKVSRLEEAGRSFYERRQEIMVEREEGLTGLYNLFHDQSKNDNIAELRKLFVELDCAVLTAYGWDDIELAHGFYGIGSDARFEISPEAKQEILERLLTLNHERYAAECRASGATIGGHGSDRTSTDPGDQNAESQESRQMSILTRINE